MFKIDILLPIISPYIFLNLVKLVGTSIDKICHRHFLLSCSSKEIS